MSLVNLAHVCSHLQNASRARLGLTSIPLTKLHLRLALGLQSQGFVQNVRIGALSPPETPPVLPEQIAETAQQLEQEPWAAYPAPDDTTPVRDALSIPANPAHRRIWLDLKYWDNKPVLTSMALVSKPTRRIHMNHESLGVIARGRRAGYVEGLTRPGECLFVSTDKGIMESRECVERQIGGLVLCRAL
ncbi:40S ribosomal protein S8 [Trichodelitschia bisporula]|uniref:40S ribosomal protein S8 n=1 Tax=Trichodelitschia bisporula TaxID=703511 RepID=A0A6G1I3J4_9PEZI|nr:40S ribosomal protein S8 [Trichodelitschia bisporula]